MTLKVVGPLLLYSNSSMDDTNPPFQFPIWQLTHKKTKRQAITKDQKRNERQTNRDLTRQIFKDYSIIKAMEST